MMDPPNWGYSYRYYDNDPLEKFYPVIGRPAGHYQWYQSDQNEHQNRFPEVSQTSVGCQYPQWNCYAELSQPAGHAQWYQSREHQSRVSEISQILHPSVCEAFENYNPGGIWHSEYGNSYPVLNQTAVHSQWYQSDQNLHQNRFPVIQTSDGCRYSQWNYRQLPELSQTMGRSQLQQNHWHQNHLSEMSQTAHPHLCQAFENYSYGCGGGLHSQSEQNVIDSVENKNLRTNNCDENHSTSMNSVYSEPGVTEEIFPIEHLMKQSVSSRDQINERVVDVATDDRVNVSVVGVTDEQSPNKEAVDQLHNHDDGKLNVLTGSVNVKPKNKVGCDKSNMIVKTSDDKSAKKLFCPFCDQLQTKLARHLEVMHKDEPDVQKFLSFPKRSKQRRVIQDSLRKIGTLNWNQNAEINNRELITSRRPNPKYSNNAERFTCCPYCAGSYSKKGLRLHVKDHCSLKPIVSDEISKSERVITALGASVEARHHEKASKALIKVFKNFRDDSLVRSLKFDWLIIAYGNKMSAEYPQRKNKDMIRSHLRYAGRFLRELKLIESQISDLASAYQPKYFDQAVEAIQNVASFDADRGEYGAPGSATKCVTILKKIGSVLISEYIKRDDQESQRITQNFMTLMNSDIHGMINKTANRNQNERQRLKGVHLPAMDDVKNLAQYLQSESSKCYNDLLKSFDYMNWLHLSKLTMASIIIFNRKRVGDVENILVEDFKRRGMVNEKTNDQLFASLSDESKQVAKRYSRMQVCGKKDRNVPVLLNSSMEKNIDLLISHRKDAGLTTANKFLFALPSSTEDKVLKGGRVIHDFVRLCGTKNPSTINGTNMRKHLATHCVSQKLDDPEVADVCDFMGHAESVHRKVYRQNTIDRQVFFMSKVLEAAQGNIAEKETVGEDDIRTRAVRKRKKPTSGYQEKSQRVCPEQSQRVGRKSKK